MSTRRPRADHERGVDGFVCRTNRLRVHCEMDGRGQQEIIEDLARMLPGSQVGTKAAQIAGNMGTGPADTPLIFVPPWYQHAVATDSEAVGLVYGVAVVLPSLTVGGRRREDVTEAQHPLG